MPISNYPFRKDQISRTPSPLVPVILTNPENGFEFPTWGLIDTGADRTIVPGYIAKEVYHNLKGAEVECDFGSGVGGDVRFYMHTFTMQLLSYDKSNSVTTNPVIEIKKHQFAVCENINTLILGVDDFLKDYKLIIDYPKQVFSIKKPS
ncbi:MAG: hypothetical protein K8R02_01205 [Anaerohalosphaeraceae bacterium]|nr:hypothetical protein [Anaerohalosphaeraceae bacterium]